MSDFPPNDPPELLPEPSPVEDRPAASTAESRHDEAAAALAERPIANEPTHEPASYSIPEPTPEPTMTAGLDAEDTRSHVERINPGDNPAYIPGIAEGPRSDGRKPYRVLVMARHAGDVILPAGTIVMLLPDEVRDHHAPVIAAAPAQAIPEPKAPEGGDYQAPGDGDLRPELDPA